MSIIVDDAATLISQFDVRYFRIYGYMCLSRRQCTLKRSSSLIHRVFKTTQNSKQILVVQIRLKYNVYPFSSLQTWLSWNVCNLNASLYIFLYLIMKLTKRWHKRFNMLVFLVSNVFPLFCFISMYYRCKCCNRTMLELLFM
mgnify:CR=1 FL=1